MDNFALIEKAQANAPSYLNLKDDGADFHCDECGESGRKGFIVGYTPDGKHHKACHKDCVDESWLVNAKEMGTI